MTTALSASLDPFVVPPEREAREPAELRGVARDGVRMLISDRAAGTISHHRFDDLPKLLRRGDLVVANDSATLPAALAAQRADGSEIALHASSCVAAGLWVVEPRGPVREGETLYLPGGATAKLLSIVDSRSRRLWYAGINADESYTDYLHAHGEPIHYRYVHRSFPLAYYQTVFARVPGSAEMPSAARPFTARTLAALDAQGVDLRTITLHCGVSSAETHEPPQPEPFEVPYATASAINAARALNRRVIAIGTTVVRALESAVRDGSVIAVSGRTELLVSPERPPQVVDGLLTGFHEPRASHLAMLAAFLDGPALSAAYAAALEHDYLWHEFGDTHLIL